MLQRFLLTALAEYGTKEAQGAANNARIVEYHKTTKLRATEDAVAWCSAFANWVVKQCGGTATDSAAARSWLSWGKQIVNPAPGCIVVFSRENNPAMGHVGFFVRELNGQIYVLGGNQSDGVNIAPYPKSRLLQYRAPLSYISVGEICDAELSKSRMIIAGV